MKVFKYVNIITYDKVLGSSREIAHLSAKELAKVIEYILDQGVQYEVIRKKEGELKAFVTTDKVTDASILRDDYVNIFK